MIRILITFSTSPFPFKPFRWQILENAVKENSLFVLQTEYVKFQKNFTEKNGFHFYLVPSILTSFNHLSGSFSEKAVKNLS